MNVIGTSSIKAIGRIQHNTQKCVINFNGIMTNLKLYAVMLRISS